MFNCCDEHEIDIAVGTGKSMMTAVEVMYDVYVMTTVQNMLSMNRIPRKLKKQYKKNPYIWTTYSQNKLLDKNI